MVVSKMHSNHNQPKSGKIRKRSNKGVKIPPPKPVISKKNKKHNVKVTNNQARVMMPTAVSFSRKKMEKSSNSAKKMKIFALKRQIQKKSNLNDPTITPLYNKLKKSYKFSKGPKKKISVRNHYNKHGIKYVRRKNGGPYPLPKSKSKLRN